MVLVVFDRVNYGRPTDDIYQFVAYFLELNVSVAGYIPRDYQDVMDFISKAVRVIRNYHSKNLPYEQRILAYMLDELSREKKFLAVTPEDTHYDEIKTDAYPTEISPEVAFFVDRGSPYRHVFTIQKKTYERHPEVHGYIILGRGFNTDILYNIYVYFLPDAESLANTYNTEWIAGELLEKADKLAKDNSIHYGIQQYSQHEVEEGDDEAINLDTLKDLLQKFVTVDFP